MDNLNNPRGRKILKTQKHQPKEERNTPEYREGRTHVHPEATREADKPLSQLSAARKRRVNDSGCERHFHKPARKKQQKRQQKTSLRNVKYRQGPEQLEVACPPRQGLNRGQN